MAATQPAQPSPEASEAVVDAIAVEMVRSIDLAHAVAGDDELLDLLEQRAAIEQNLHELEKDIVDRTLALKVQL